jgi:hypothetical protein
MSKPVLGRGLDHLMEGCKVVGQSGPDPATPPPAFSHGLGNFLQRDLTARIASDGPLRRRLRASLLAADALLLAIVAWLLRSHPGALGWAGTGFCLAAIGLGAWLAWLAFSLPEEASRG